MYDKMMKQQLLQVDKNASITQSEGEKELDTDKSDVSFESVSSRSVGTYFEEMSTPKH
jgi:hypothetical protein